MVRAILEGRKNKTRRIVKFGPDRQVKRSEVDRLGFYELDGTTYGLLSPYGMPGDRLWVRETWAEICYNETGCDGLECLYHGYEYRADKPGAKYAGGWDNGFDSSEVPPGCKWRPSIFMPRTACRLMLEVTDVRVERLKDISEYDAEQEGFVSDWAESGFSAVNSFAELWDDINGEGSFDSDPFVWVITFKKLDT